VRIEIGGGLKPALVGDDVVQLDPVHGKGPWRRPAQVRPWPTSDESAELVYASHVLEHIPAGKPRIDVFNEAHRVLTAGGVFHIIVPRFPHWTAVADPTHVSFFVRESFDYFTGDYGADADYGMKRWQRVYRIVEEEQIDVLLKPIK